MASTTDQTFPERVQEDDFPPMKTAVSWAKVPGYELIDQFVGECSMTRMPWKKGEPVFRGALIEMEGHFTVSLASAEELGLLAGLVRADDYDRLIEERVMLLERRDELEAQVQQLLSAVELLREIDETHYVSEDDDPASPDAG